MNYLNLLCTSLIIGGVAFTAKSQTILHVRENATGANNGTSWANAYTNLQSAINTARINPTNSYEIWVAGGTYKPTHDPSNNANPTNVGDKTFYLVNGTKFYGGFSGTETLLSQRDLSLTANTTVLSGDLNNSNTTNSGDAYHVVVSVGATATTVFDGFTVTGGYASLATPLTVAGQSLYRDAGAGMINSASSPTIANCIFSGNKSTGNAGGLFNVNASSPVISNTTFIRNTASYGGGMYNIGSSPNINNCTFSLDTATAWGGGLLNSEASSPIISNTTFSSNRASHGGGMHTRSTSSSPTISNSTFYNNVATADGGAIYSTVSSTPSISKSVFSGNTAGYGGGIIIDGTANYSINNCLVTGNTAVNLGGGILLNTAQGRITNCTVSGNSSSNVGGGLYYNNVAGGAIVNSIIYGNTTTNTADANRKEIYKDGVSINPDNALIISYSIVKDYLNTASNDFTWGTGNSVDDPLFVNPQPASAAPTLMGDYNLRLCSPAINMGDAQTNTTGYSVQAGTTDLGGNQRINGTTIDMGAYEKQGNLTSLSNFAALSNSNDNGLIFVPTCADDDNWTWYGSENNPDSLSFAIKWGAANSLAQANAAISLTVDNNNFIATNGTNRAIVTMGRYWNVNLGAASLVAPVSLRFLYNPADTIAMHNEALALNIGTAHELIWFQTTGVAYGTNLVTFDNINNGNYQALTAAHGMANNIAYVQFDNISSLNGGTAAIKLNVEDPSSISDFKNDLVFDMFPNPTTGSFTINLGSEPSKNATVKIFDYMGRILYNNDIKSGSTIINTQINSGLYHVVINSDGKTYTQKLVVK